MRDLEARQVRRYAPVGPAVVVTPNDAEVRGDVQLLLRVVADDIVDRQVAVVGRRRECRRAALDIEVRERARTRGRTAFEHVEDVPRSGRRHGVVARVRDPCMVHVVWIRIDRARESRRRGRVVDPVPGDVRRIRSRRRCASRRRAQPRLVPTVFRGRPCSARARKSLRRRGLTVDAAGQVTDCSSPAGRPAAGSRRNPAC